MLFTRLFSYLGGYLLISVSGVYPERFLNVCANRQIWLWKVFPCAGGKLRCCISLRAFRLLPPVARKTGVQIKILEKRGLPFLVAKSRRRMLFVIGLALFLTAMVVVNQFIWKIEIEGNQTLTSTFIINRLAECGLHIGSLRPGLDEKSLQNQMMIRVPELAWLWVDMSGSKVIVQVRERIRPPKLMATEGCCDLVAARDGVIESMAVIAGRPLVSVGDTVRTGDMLASGLLVSDKGAETRQVQADGTVYARVWYEQTKAFSVWSPVTHHTGRHETKYTLALFGWRLPLFRRAETAFDTYEETERDYELTIGGFYLGVGLHSVTYSEQETTYERLSAESTIEAGAFSLKNEIDAMTTADARLNDTQVSSVVLDEDTVEVTVVAEYVENIAVQNVTR